MNNSDRSVARAGKRTRRAQARIAKMRRQRRVEPRPEQPAGADKRVVRRILAQAKALAAKIASA